MVNQLHILTKGSACHLFSAPMASLEDFKTQLENFVNAVGEESQYYFSTCSWNDALFVGSIPEVQSQIDGLIQFAKDNEGQKTDTTPTE